MNIGLVTKWFNRGQAYVTHHLRTALDDLGHETFILARPTKDKGPLAAYIDRDGIWDQPRVTEASAWEVPGEEFVEWARANDLEAVFFDNSYQFDEIAELRNSGIKTVGRFVWEDFAPAHVAGAKRAFDVVYSVTRCEQRRYAELGVDSPHFPWGVHPELLEVSPDRDPEIVTYYFPGALLGPRKPHREVIEAFSAARGENLRLLVKSQVERRSRFLHRAMDADPRIELLVEDLPHDEHLQVFANCHVCLGPSRWEGLGLFLYEATAFGMPVITNDDPPMNEVIEHGVNGLLAGSRPDGTTDSGVSAHTPDIRELTDAIERLADPELRAELSAGAEAARDRWSWRHTVAGVKGLVDSLESVPATRS